MCESKTQKTINNFAGLHKPHESLSREVVKGGFWVFALRGTSQGNIGLPPN
jgi:hypothetical protein